MISKYYKVYEYCSVIDGKSFPITASEVYNKVLIIYIYFNIALIVDYLIVVKA